MSSHPPSSEPPPGFAAADPLSAAELEDRLDELLDPVLSSRRTATGLAGKLARLARKQQDFVLHWIGVIARTNPEMAYQFAAAAPRAFAVLEAAAIEAWIIQAMDAYDREGLYRGSAVFKNVAQFATLASEASTAVTFEEAARVLQLFLCGLSGRRLRLDAAAHAYTDTETIFLPPRIALLPAREENFLVYKATATLLWAQARYGTFTLDLPRALRAYPDHKRALALFHYLETVRLEGRIAVTLPGLARDMRRLRAPPAAPDARLVRLEQPSATVEDTVSALEDFHHDFAPPHYCYMGELRWEQAAAVRGARIAREKTRFGAALTRVLREHDPGAPRRPDAAERFSLAAAATREGGAAPVRLSFDGKPVAPPDNVKLLMDSILQDLGEIPEDYLSAAGEGGYRGQRPAEPGPADAWKHGHHEYGAYFYNEWDHRRRHYRKNWCVLRELNVHPGSAGFVDAIFAKYAPQIMHLKRTFELLRGEERLLKRQQNGDDIDLDAVIAAYADMRSGMELSERLLVKRHKAERDLAVMFMVDMSGSTKGWINDAEREALVMLCEALEVLGDRYAIYGFSGITRKRCEIFRVKRFDEPYGETIKKRIAGIVPQDYTRMGAAIRHLATLLDRIEARTKLLIALSDGKPDDYSDNYRGEYGIEDTRQALIEAHRAGIKPFCITIDREARDYLPHMYGPVNWTLVDNVARLPLKVAEIYRRLTT